MRHANHICSRLYSNSIPFQFGIHDIHRHDFLSILVHPIEISHFPFTPINHSKFTPIFQFPFNQFFFFFSPLFLFK